ncbi:sodium/proton antiporter (CPA1 family) [Anseongella ginsenosidimutans]|uniref:Sodium/proton antiporter (CPA1 family) n=1 Tax=Anseongella ginsenosidimutans TaxID=496056 RepID=A0A4R3KYB4_9SPHI|nr:sodium:proton antiporter [Anseongella ginsenosidimutans]QEC51647.1 sodium:proton antiporter [Anseongella ginsenosidimutans]TCS88982.1 sodium/proton antiporter (CPA1 family) [Anseongella ginsenosidimutans]
MDTYIISLSIIGLSILGMACMPAITRKLKVSYGLLYVLAGIVLYAFFGKWLPWPSPVWHEDYAIHITELAVIIALMGTGLKIDQAFSFRRWRIPFRLVFITMLLCIAAVSGLGIVFLGLDPASALLLGAVLAPTDPVLASEVQVGPPLEKEKDNIRFPLTAEAGMNDGMAFPFVWLAIMGTQPSGQAPDFAAWAAYDLLYRLGAGILCGYVMGRLLAWLLFHLPFKGEKMVIQDGFVAISGTLLVYGLTELIHGYGFIAVFVAAVTLRNNEMEHQFHLKLHEFTDQMERMVLAVLLLLFGGSLVTGLLNNLDWEMAIFGLAFVLLIRPLAGLTGLAGTGLHLKEKLAISFFGIRGIGSLFYLSFAFNETGFGTEEVLWTITAFTILISIVLHGLTAAVSLEKLQRAGYRRRR